MWETTGRLIVGIVRFFRVSTERDGNRYTEEAVQRMDGGAGDPPPQDYELVYWGAAPGPWY